MPHRNGIAVSWTSLISTLAFATILAGAAWTLFQTQFGAITGTINQNREGIERVVSAIRRDLEGRDAEIKHELQFLRQRIIVQRTELIGRDEFNQFQKALLDRLDRLDRQLQVLEQTRPTTVELQSTARALDAQVNRVEERVKTLEQFIRGTPPPRAPEAGR